MPIVTLELVEDANQQPVRASVVQSLANELGKLFGSPEYGTWIKVRYLPRDHYAENRADESAPAQLLDATVRPTFVEVLKRDNDTVEHFQAREREAARIAAIVAQHLERPIANTHVIYAPAGAGRVAFGGQLIPYSE